MQLEGTRATLEALSRLALPAAFTWHQREALEALRLNIQRRAGRAVRLEYGETDDGQEWAALLPLSMPHGAWDSLGPVVTVLCVLNGGQAAAVALANGDLAGDAQPITDFGALLDIALTAGLRRCREINAQGFYRPREPLLRVYEALGGSDAACVIDRSGLTARASHGRWFAFEHAGRQLVLESAHSGDGLQVKDWHGNIQALFPAALGVCLESVFLQWLEGR